MAGVLELEDGIAGFIQFVAAEPVWRWGRPELERILAERFLELRLAQEPGFVGIEEPSAPDAGGMTAVAIEGDVDSTGKADEDGAPSGLFEEGPLHDRAVAWNQLVLPVLFDVALWHLLAFLDVSPDRRDLLFGIATENVWHGRLAAGPQGRHQGSGTVAGWVEQVLAKPAGAESVVEIAKVGAGDPRRRFVSPVVARRAVYPAVRPE